MMKKNNYSTWVRQSIWVVFLLAFAFAIAEPVDAQTPWVINGNNINNTNTGNVGIGTATPASKLEVIGNIALSDSSRITARSDWGNYLMPYTAFGRMAFGTAGVDRISILYNGNVGIGTTGPSAPLEIDRIADGATLFRIIDRSINAFTSAPKMVFNAGGTDIANIQASYNNGALRLDLGAGLTSTARSISILNSGNVGVGTTAPSSKLHVVGDVTLSGTGNLSATGTISAGNIVAKYQDIAEWVPARHVIAAGTVVVLDTGESNRVVASHHSYDTRVAGVVSDNPGVILGEGGPGRIKVATTGRVRVKVDATRTPIRVGDLLVTSDREGVAMRSEPLSLDGTPIHRPGTIIGKALEPLNKGFGEILVLLSLQ